MIFRFDDINPNTNFFELDRILDVLKESYPAADLVFGVTCFSRYTPTGAVYPELPLRGKPFRFFLEVERFVQSVPSDLGEIASHGLWHLDHTLVSPDLAEASVVTSCSFLNTKVFIPPFNSWDMVLAKTCERNGVTLVKSEEAGWRSMECQEFDPDHDRWYLHPWRWTAETLAGYLSRSKVTQ